MEKRLIGLIAAMPEEIEPLLRQIGSYTQGKLCGFAAYQFTVGAREIRLIESGLGPERGAAAAQALITASTPELVINFGFAGAMTAGPKVGDLVVAERLLSCRNGSFQEQRGLAEELTNRLIGFLAEDFSGKTFQIFRGTFIMAERIMGKRELAGLLPAGLANPVLEMESAAIAQEAAEVNVPLCAIRAISDSAEEELGFAIEDLTDREMKVRLGKVLLTVAKKPWIVPQLLRLARNSRRAGENLATALMSLLESL